MLHISRAARKVAISGGTAPTGLAKRMNVLRKTSDVGIGVQDFLAHHVCCALILEAIMVALRIRRGISVTTMAVWEGFRGRDSSRTQRMVLNMVRNASRVRQEYVKRRMDEITRCCAAVGVGAVAAPAAAIGMDTAGAGAAARAGADIG